MATFAELPGILEAVKARAERGARPAVLAMAERYRRVVLSELQLSRAQVGQFGTPAPAGGPPAWRTGRLALSVTTSGPFGGGAFATASVGPHTIYAKTQEYGEVHYARRFRYMHWVNSGGSWWKKRVDIPARPYLRPALDRVVADGSLTRDAAAAWVAATGL